MGIISDITKNMIFGCGPEMGVIAPCYDVLCQLSQGNL
jgi:hypothetical protein